MKDLKQMEVWFVTGSQHLYGEAALKQVAADSKAVAAGLDAAAGVPVRVVYKPVLTRPGEITALCREANAAEKCIGLVCWMHTFSPAQMWIGGLKVLTKPTMHLHTQFNRDIPWGEIDMDFMNLNQSAHGGREFGFICTRLRQERKVVVGHWQDKEVVRQVGVWCRAAAAWADAQGARIARFGDNMRNVAVTEGDKVEAQIRLGYAVDGYGVGDLVERVEAVTEGQVEQLCGEYEETYELAPELRKGGEKRQALQDVAAIELGLRAFLEEGGYTAYTDTFEDLHGLKQLPGLATQRLMADGYGFGAEGDWKHAAMVRAMKVMTAGTGKGTSFMEDYTYHLDPAGPMVLGAHMLEICPSIAKGKVACQLHGLDIGGKEPPVRLVFGCEEGEAVNASLVDMGNRFRLVVNEVEVVSVKERLPKLPVARALWRPRPDLATAAAAWIHAGGAHHTAFSLGVTAEHLEDWAAMAGVELVVIDSETRLREFKKELRWNEMYYHLAQGL